MSVRIAFDPSIVTTGYAVLKGKELVTFGDIKVKGKDLSQRLAYLSKQVQLLIESYQPGQAAVEKAPSFSYARSTNGFTGKGVNAEAILINGYATGAILAALGMAGVRAQELDAHTWKKMGNFNPGKDYMINLARSLYPFLRGVELSDHAAEAICMAHLCQI